MGIAKGSSLRAVIIAAGNALAEQTFENCTCPKPKGFKSVEDIETAISNDKEGRAKLDALIQAGHTTFVRKTLLFNPEGEPDRLMKKDEWVLINPSNGDEVRLTSPIARAYGHLKAQRHLDEQHTDQTKTAAQLDRERALASWMSE